MLSDSPESRWSKRHQQYQYHIKEKKPTTPKSRATAKAKTKPVAEPVVEPVAAPVAEPKVKPNSKPQIRTRPELDTTKLHPSPGT